MLEHSLDYTTTVGMGGKSVDLIIECLDDELYMFGRDPLDSFLDNVISILVFDAFQDMAIQFFDQCCLLLG